MSALRLLIRETYEGSKTSWLIFSCVGSGPAFAIGAIGIVTSFIALIDRATPEELERFLYNMD